MQIKFSIGTRLNPHNFLRKLHANALNYFILLLNEIFKSVTFPNAWKLASIIPILKPYKDAANKLTYRPISLLSTLSKSLEKILNRRFTWHLKANNLLNPSQYDGCKNRSSTMALAELDALIHIVNTLSLIHISEPTRPY